MSVDKITAYKSIIVILLVLAFSAAFLVYGILSKSFTVKNTGYIEAIGVEVYFDAECTNRTSTIDWGYIRPGGAKNIAVYIKNNGTVPMILSYNITSWSPPEAQNYITFSWNAEGAIVNGGQVIQVTLSLAVDENVSDISSFSFDLVIIGTEAP